MKQPSDQSIDVAARSSVELRRVSTTQADLSMNDSAVIPDIEAWMKGRSKTPEREILRQPFDDSQLR